MVEMDLWRSAPSKTYFFLAVLMMEVLPAHDLPFVKALKNQNTSTATHLVSTILISLWN